jgi:hypothetical protein
MSTYKHVNYSWDDTKAASLDPVGRLVYRSNILGDDQRINRGCAGLVVAMDPASVPHAVSFHRAFREPKVEVWTLNR